MKKILAGIMAATIVASMASISAFAAGTGAAGEIVDGDNVDLKTGAFNKSSNKGIFGEAVEPNSTFYFTIGLDQNAAIMVGFGEAIPATAANGFDAKNVDIRDIINKDLFTFKNDKDTNAKMIKSVTLDTEKTINGGDRANYIKFVLNDSTTTDEMKISGTLTFKARGDAKSYTGDKTPKSAATAWLSGDTVKLPYTIWMNNKTSKDNAGTGDRIVMDPTKNDENIFVWGDDRAAIFFEATDNAGKFYARLTTTSQADIYAEYGDPQNADLYFFNFVSNATIPATARGTLTLGIPWDRDADYQIDPANAFIYSVDAEGMLSDVTDQFTYSEDNDGTTGIEGWSTKTRVLGNYVVSDTELDLATTDVAVDAPATDAPATDIKDIPNTGSSDMVNVAVVAAVVSLAAAGAVAFRKVK